MKKIIFTENAPSPVGPYSQAVEVNGMLYCSGQIAINPKNNELVLDDIQSETKQVMENIGEVLRAASYSYDDVIKTAIFLNDMDNFALVNEVYAKYFESDPPARSCVAVRELPKSVNVEIEVIASKA